MQKNEDYQLNALNMYLNIILIIINFDFNYMYIV